MGQQDLTALPRGQWSTVVFNVPSSVRAALLGDFPSAQFFFSANTSVPTGVLLDNFRFGGSMTQRTVSHQNGSQGIGVNSNPFLSFENLSDWTSPAGGLSHNAQTVSDGAYSLAVPSGSWREVRSRNFSTSELPTLGNELSLDVFIPDPQLNPWWVGDVQVYASCPSAGIYNQYVGQKSLTNLFVGEFNRLSFPVPSNVRNALAGSHSGCQLSFTIVSSQSGASFLFDRFGSFLLLCLTAASCGGEVGADADSSDGEQTDYSGLFRYLDAKEAARANAPREDGKCSIELPKAEPGQVVWSFATDFPEEEVLNYTADPNLAIDACDNVILGWYDARTTRGYLEKWLPDGSKAWSLEKHVDAIGVSSHGTIVSSENERTLLYVDPTGTVLRYGPDEKTEYRFDRHYYFGLSWAEEDEDGTWLLASSESPMLSRMALPSGEFLSYPLMNGRSGWVYSRFRDGDEYLSLFRDSYSDANISYSNIVLQRQRLTEVDGNQPYDVDELFVVPASDGDDPFAQAALVDGVPLVVRSTYDGECKTFLHFGDLQYQLSCIHPLDLRVSDDKVEVTGLSPPEGEDSPFVLGTPARLVVAFEGAEIEKRSWDGAPPLLYAPNRSSSRPVLVRYSDGSFSLAGSTANGLWLGRLTDW